MESRNTTVVCPTKERRNVSVLITTETQSGQDASSIGSVHVYSRHIKKEGNFINCLAVHVTMCLTEAKE